jgi:hypothetical protein
MIEIRVTDPQDYDLPDRPITADGPHSSPGTLAIAAGIDEAFRILNYATSADKHGLVYPGDVYSVLGELSAALAKLPQALLQMSTFLGDQIARGEVRENPHYGSHRGDGKAAVADLGNVLNGARRLATELSQRLSVAQSTISGMEAALDDE